MQVQSLETEPAPARRPYFISVRWGAVFAGSTVGIATYLLFALFGVAVGLSAIEPVSAPAVTSVPVMTGIWSTLSMLVAAYVGGYVSARMSGLTRMSDGLLHGFVAWASITVLFAYLTTTTVGTVLGGTLGFLGQGIEGTSVSGAPAPAAGARRTLENMVRGNPAGANASASALLALRQRLRAQDRAGAVAVLTDRIGFSSAQADELVGQLLPLFEPGNAVATLTVASWWLFFGMVLSLILGIWGGAVGARTSGQRILGDHRDERQLLS